MRSRWVYLAYIDSVKYFQPERSAATGNCALRTLVYHELLQSYLAYIQARGFTSMFIWACPPLQVRALAPTDSLNTQFVPGSVGC